MAELKNGKLYEDGKEVKPEVGNPAHIEALRNAGAYIQPLFTQEKILDPIQIEPTVSISANVEFDCYCGNSIDEDFELESDEVDWELKGEDLHCGSCGRSFVIICDGGLFVKEVGL